MSSLKNNYDTLEQLIFEENIRINTLNFHPEADVFLILLNTGSVLKNSLSDFTLLESATIDQLNNFKLIGEGTGVHWPELDEDLSLKAFLRNGLKNLITTNIR